MQNITESIDEESKRVRLKISMEKTKVMKINAKNQERITTNRQDNIEEVEEFTYLRGHIVQRRWKDYRSKEKTLEGKSFIVRLKTIWSSKSVTRKTKLKLHRTLVVLGIVIWLRNMEYKQR